MKDSIKYLLIALAGALLFVPLLGHVHLFDWDEVNFAECTREMIISKDYLRAQIDFMPFWEKPPFFIWMQVLAMKCFGVGEFAARLPNAIVGVITLCTLFYAGKKVRDEKMGLLWVILYVTSWLPHFYFKSGIIDPTFNLFIFLSWLQIYLILHDTKRLRHAALAGIFLGLAVLTKGPVAILVVSLSALVFVISKKGLGGYKVGELLLIILCAALPIALWLGAAVLNYGAVFGKWFIGEFLAYQVRLFTTEDSDHGGPFFYHFVVLLIGCFPAVILLFQYRIKRSSVISATAAFNSWMWILFGVVLILFSIVKTKIVHYSSLCYFPLTWLAAVQLYKLLDGETTIRKGVKVLLIGIGSIWALLLIALPIVGINKDKLIPHIEDPFAVGNLQAHVPWSYAECTFGVAYLVIIIGAVVLMQRNIGRGLMVLAVAQIAAIQFTIYHFTPKIEAYSQRAAIDFYASQQGKNVYIRPLGYKSYAHLFYSRKLQQNELPYAILNERDSVSGTERPPHVNEAWLLNGNITKPVYFVCKVQDKIKYMAMPQLEMLYEKNGFVFFKRK